MNLILLVFSVLFTAIAVNQIAAAGTLVFWGLMSETEYKIAIMCSIINIISVFIFFYLS